MSKVALEWVTPDADACIARMARVSNPGNQSNPNISGLLNYCMREGHVSPFEMANACLEIETTRDIGRQILRHRSFSFQEFSQRYASTDLLPDAPLRECRMQDMKNRQGSLETDDPSTVAAWAQIQEDIQAHAYTSYISALALGIAKEQARSILPEGLTNSRLYMNGTIRSWLHYLKSRLDPSTQKEHRFIAQQALAILRVEMPVTMEAFFPQEKE